MYDILMKYHVKHVLRTRSWSNKKHAWHAPAPSSLVGEGQKFLFWCAGGTGGDMVGGEEGGMVT